MPPKDTDSEAAQRDSGGIELAGRRSRTPGRRTLCRPFFTIIYRSAKMSRNGGTCFAPVKGNYSTSLNYILGKVFGYYGSIACQRDV